MLTMPTLKQTILNMIPDALIIFFARPYVAGSTMKSAIDAADRIYKKRGLLSSIDILGEEVKDEAKARQDCDLYLKLIDTLGDRKYTSISFKPTHMGFYVSEKLCRENIEKIVKKAYERGFEVTMDMEDIDLTDFTVNFYRELAQKYPGFGTVLQAKLWRTCDDIDRLDGIKAVIRLCTGIYNVERYAFQKKSAMKDNLLHLMQKMLRKGHKVQIATHDEKYIRLALKYIEEWKIPKDRFEFQFIMGVPRDGVISELRAKGIDIRIYIPFCEKWSDGIAYLRRRLNANPNFIFYVIKNMLRGSF